MGEQRSKLGYELNNRHTYKLDELTSHLEGKDFNHENEYFEFLLKGAVTSEGIRSLLSLPYEIAMTEANGNIVLTTGLTSNMGLEEDYTFRRLKSRISFHTHPVNGRELPVITPSFSDVIISEFSSDKTMLALAHANGIMIYSKPAFDPDTNTPCEDKEARDVLLVYCMNRGVDVTGVREWFRQYDDLSDIEKIKLQRQFVEETQMIVDEAPWEDQKGLERVISKIFGGISH